MTQMVLAKEYHNWRAKRGRQLLRSSIKQEKLKDLLRFG